MDRRTASIQDQAKRRKIYVSDNERPEIRVPFTEVVIGDSHSRSGPVPNPPLRLYDTSGPGSKPRNGLPALRRQWILRRGDVEEYEGRPVMERDNGRAAPARGGDAARATTDRPAQACSPLRALRSPSGKAVVTQRHYARLGVITEEMRFAALREGLDP